MDSRPNSPNLALPESDTNQTATVRILRREDRIGIEYLSQRLEDDDLGAIPDSKLTNRPVPPTATSAAGPDMASACHSKASSLAGSQGIAVHGSTASLGSDSVSSRQEMQHRIVRVASFVATTTAVGQSFGTSVYPRSSETSAVRGEMPRARSPHSRRARGKERVLSYLSEVSHASTLIAFGEDLGVPEPPSPSAWSPACARRIDKMMRIAFWFLLICIVLMTPIYVWMFQFIFGRT